MEWWPSHPSSFIRELYGKDAKGKLKTVPDGIWKITSNIFYAEREKVKWEYIKNGENRNKTITGRN